MSAIDSNMSSVAMKTCDVITAVQSGDGQTWFMGIRRGAYSPTLTDDKAIVNNHLVCEAGWKLDCVAKQHGGSQCLWFPDGNKITQEDAKQNEDVASILTSKQAGAAQETKNLNETTPNTAMDIDWKQMSGHCTDEALAKTLVYTMQYFPN
eukprot:14059178-Ditylum_brightwellii.AAC.1